MAGHTVTLPLTPTVRRLSLAGYVVFDAFSPFVVAATTAVAAGAMLTMIVDTMIPEAFAETHDWAGLIAVLGLLVSFALTAIIG